MSLQESKDTAVCRGIHLPFPSPVPPPPRKERKEGHGKGYILSKEKTRLCCLSSSSVIVLVGSESFWGGWEERGDIEQRKDPKTVCTWRSIF